MSEFVNANLYIKKKLVHDILPCNDWRRFMEGLDLIPASEEVEDMEHTASHIRLNNIAPIADSIRIVAGLAGEIVGRSILENQGIEPDEEMLDTYQRVARASCLAVIANLAELNLLHVGGR